MALPPGGLSKGKRTLGSGMHCLLPLGIPFTPPPSSATPQSSQLPRQRAWVSQSDSNHNL